LIKVDTSSFIPLYEQIKTQFKRAISLGDLCPNDPLPSIRDLATRLVINPNTVARAYRELELEGVIYTRKGKGCFISSDSTRLIGKEKESLMNQIIDQAIDDLKEFCPDGDEIRQLFEIRLDRAKAIKAGEEHDG
jgi:GntR family transcriptional regulator